jgi:hypothetical protein
MSLESELSRCPTFLGSEAIGALLLVSQPKSQSSSMGLTAIVPGFPELGHCCVPPLQGPEATLLDIPSLDALLVTVLC